MSKNSAPNQLKPLTIHPETAVELYGAGVRRLRKPKPMTTPNGLDTNSLDFRGVRAAMDVVGVFPHTYDADGRRNPVDPNEVKTHMDSSLATIREAGRVPLADDFVGGYKRMTEAFTRPQEPITPAEQIHITQRQ